MNAWGSSLISALILSVAIVIAGLLVGGRYTATFGSGTNEHLRHGD